MAPVSAKATWKRKEASNSNVPVPLEHDTSGVKAWRPKQDADSHMSEESSDCVITFAQLLACRPQLEDLVHVVGPRLRSWSGGAKTAMFEPPPGLSLPSPSEPESVMGCKSSISTTESQPLAPQEPLPPPSGPELVMERESSKNVASPAKLCTTESPPVAPQEHKVLLSGLPAAMLSEPMLRVMLGQAQLEDGVIAMSTRPGKALLTFSSLAWACQCIMHYNGLQWGSSGIPISAMLVRTVKTGTTPVVNKNAMSANAPTFVPMSASAPVFVPLSATAPTFDGKRERVISDASTEAGPISDEASVGCESESEG